MRIHYLVSSLDGGGAEFIIPRIYRLFSKLGHDVSIIALEPKDRRTQALLERENIPYRLLFDKCRSKTAYLWRYLKLARAERPDLIWCSLSVASLVGGLAGRALSIPVVSFKHSASLRWYTRATLRLSRFWIADSSAVARWMLERSGLPKNHLLTWPIYCATPAAPRPDRSRTGRPLILLSVGRLHPVKNYHLLLQALGILHAQIPDLKNELNLVIVGDGSERGRLTELAAKLDISDLVRFAGHLDDPAPMLAEADVYIQPSVYEGMCLAMHEAMAAGLAPIVSPVGQMKASVSHGETGHLLSDTDPADIVKAIKHFLENPEKFAEMGKKAQARIQKLYSEEAFARTGQEVLETIERTITVPDT